MLKRTWIILLIVVLVAVSLMAGCSGNTEDTPTATAQATQDATQTQTETDTVNTNEQETVEATQGTVIQQDPNDLEIMTVPQNGDNNAQSGDDTPVATTSPQTQTQAPTEATRIELPFVPAG